MKHTLPLLNFILLAAMTLFTTLVMTGVIDIGYMLDALAAMTMGPVLLVHLVVILILHARKVASYGWAVALGFAMLAYLMVALMLVQAGNARVPWG